ncbi:MAPEG family protein [Methylobacterium sp. J-068]|uniref:MAPEG family protein n=1 Tax=Methylobacterium sp. J-068 TaxID=2836649 RepID=UPI001FBA5F36|nr:MAPEG family protein [Methylobacterium sp. J-068]MCJ2032908.1 MAPEG family protein [Methylobacterium sp. J-068]
MDRDAAFLRERRGVRRGAGLALLIGAAALGLAFGFARPSDPGLGPGDRIAFALRVDLCVVGWFAVAIGNVARLRFASPADIGAGTASASGRRVTIARAILGNTGEQAGLAVFAHCLVAVTLDAYAVLVPVLAGLFCAGRLLFWRGYAGGASARALGFGLTFYPSLAALIIAAAASLS